MEEVIEFPDSSDGTKSFHHDSEASEREGEGIEEDQVTHDGSQDEEETDDGAESSDDQEIKGAEKSRLAGVWRPKPGETRRPT